MNDSQVGPQMYHQHGNDARRTVQQMERIVQYPDARHKKIGIRMFFEWKCTKDLALAFAPEDVNVDFLGDSFQGMAERY
ncbi:hypothetical protein ABG067_004722 [Albugo candida]